MYKELEARLFNTLKAEFDYILKTETDKKQKKEKLITILKIQRVIADYDEIEPIIKEYFDKKAENERWER